VAQTKKCYECKKEITSGKFYNFYTGKKGGKVLGIYKDREFFCPFCAEKEKANDIIYLEKLIKVEWEIGNQNDEEILNFEKKWLDYQNESSNRINNETTNLTLDFIQKAKQELEPYLQKPNIVEKSFGGKIEGCGNPQLSFCYLFSKSALDDNYRKKVVGPTISEFLEGDPNQEINIINVGASPGVPGRTAGIWRVDDQLSINYVWNDGPERICRRIRFLFIDHKLALQTLCRSLKIKEKELRGDNSPNQNPPKPNSPVENLLPENKGLNGGIIFLLLIGVIVILTVIIGTGFLVYKAKKKL